MELIAPGRTFTVSSLPGLTAYDPDSLKGIPYYYFRSTRF